MDILYLEEDAIGYLSAMGNALSGLSSKPEIPPRDKEEADGRAPCRGNGGSDRAAFPLPSSKSGSSMVSVVSFI